MTAARPALRALTRAALTLALTGSTLAVAAVGASSGSAAVTAPAALAAVAAAGDAPRSLSVNGLPAPVDVDTVPTFGWHLGSAGQTAYELVVSSTAARAAAGDGDVWSSGRVEGDQQSGVAYDGPALEDSERYFWSVRTADTAGDASPWAEPATFGTGTAWADSTPVWAPDPAGSPARDYTLRATVTVDQVALGLRFRAADAQNSYMWQFRADTNRLVPHRQLGGTFTTLGSAVTCPPGRSSPARRSPWRSPPRAPPSPPASTACRSTSAPTPPPSSRRAGRRAHRPHRERAHRRPLRHRRRRRGAPRDRVRHGRAHPALRHGGGRRPPRSPTAPCASSRSSPTTGP